MSTSSLPSLAKSINYTLPPLTVLIGLLGITGGLTTLNSPSTGAKLFGVPLPATDSSPSVSAVQATPTVYIRTMAIRNVISGVSLLAFTGLYGLAKLEKLTLASTTVKRCLGVSLSLGMVVGWMDGFIIEQYVEEMGGAVDEDIKEKGSGHMFFAPIMGLIGLGWLLV